MVVGGGFVRINLVVKLPKASNEVIFGEVFSDPDLTSFLCRNKTWK